MKPPLTLLLFTVLLGASSGVVFGVALLLTYMAAHGATPLEVPAMSGLIAAFLLTAFGNLAAFFHLHNRQPMFLVGRGMKTSWISREGLTAGLYTAALALALILWLGGNPPAWAREPLIWVVTVLGFVAVFTTGMLYATIKAIPLWNTPLTLQLFTLYGILSGLGVEAGWFGTSNLAGTWGAVQTGSMKLLLGVGILTAALSAALKGWQLSQFREMTVGSGQELRMGAGISIPGMGPVRIVDTGVTAGPYDIQPQITRRMSSQRRKQMETGMFLLAFILPGLVYVIGLVAFGAGSAAALSLVFDASALAILVGMFMERWLFFANANHTSRIWVE